MEPNQQPNPPQTGPQRPAGFPAPPVPQAPPPGMHPQRPPFPMAPRRSGLWRLVGVVALVGIVLFNLMLFGGVFFGASLFGPQQQSPHDLIESERIPGGERKVAVIAVDGVIMEDSQGSLFSAASDNVGMVQDGLRRAAKDGSVAAVIIEVNSPGGGVTASDHIYHEIVRFREETGKPVVIYMKDLAASGGYYISAPADSIVANRTTLTGSIGVVIQGVNLHGTLTEVLKGQDATVKAGANKNMGSMWADPSTEEAQESRRLLQELVDHTHGLFKEVVRDGRGSKLKPDWETYADGRILSAQQALEIGLIDKIGYFEDALAEAERLSGVSNPQVVEYGRPMGLGALLGLSSGGVKPDALDPAAIYTSQAREMLRYYPDRPLALWVP